MFQPGCSEYLNAYGLLLNYIVVALSPAHATMWATSVGVAGPTLLAWKVLAFSLHVKSRDIELALLGGV